VEVPATPQRRRFTAQYKRSVLEQVDACTKPGEIGALLRREGLYSSVLANWRLARDRGEFASLQPKQRGRKRKQVDPRDLRITELENQLAKETLRRERAEAIVDLQKKLTTLFGDQMRSETP
jgi:hypothetical protein